MKVLNFRTCAKNNIVAIFDVLFENDLTIRALKVVKGKKGLFVSMPSFKGDGENEWIPYFSFSSEKQNEFTTRLMTLLDTQLKTLNIQG